MFKFKKLSKEDKLDPMSRQNLSKDLVLKMLNQLTEGNLDYLEENEIGDKEISSAFNTLVDQLSREKKDTTLNVNELLNEITRMNCMRSMIKSVTNQTDSLNTMVSSSEELSASIEEVSSISMQVADTTNDTNKSTQIGLQNMEQSMDFVINSFDNVKKINLEMKEVEEKAEAINSIIDIVKAIADQTNLLALNAAIESARAGEHGKGFAVVAEEVKKLAETTKQSAEEVQKNIVDLKRSINASASDMEKTSDQLESGKSLMVETINSITHMGKSIETINNTISEVAANTEEQSAVTETFTSGVVDISNESSFLMENCEETALSIYKASKHLDSIRKSLTANRSHLNDSDMIDVHKTDHLIWRWSVYNMLLGYEQVDTNRAGDYKNCSLGKWYYGIDCSDVNHLSAFKDMEEPHKKLHQAAKDAAIAYQNGNIASAEDALAEIDKYSVIVFRYLDEIKNKLN